MNYEEQQKLMVDVSKRLIDASNWLKIAANQCNGISCKKPLITSTTIAATEDSIRMATKELEIIEDAMCQLDHPEKRRCLSAMELKSLCPGYDEIIF